MSRLKKEWMPNCAMKRVIFHWTVGRYKANDFEKEHYHFLIEGDGNVVRGEHSIADNVSTADGKYAAHTLGCNTGSIGISACCMMNCQESPFQAGPCPMTETQFEVMAEVAAELCKFYDIPVTSRTVLGHGEVQINLGIKQRGKWDAMVMPWNTRLNTSQVGESFRTLVRKHMESGDEQQEELIRVKARVGGREFPDAILAGGSSFVPIRPIAGALGWSLPRIDADDLDLVIAGKTHTLPLRRIGVDGYVSSRDLAEALGVTPDWDKTTRTILIG
jgi:hypothetical protein